MQGATPKPSSNRLETSLSPATELEARFSFSASSTAGVYGTLPLIRGEYTGSGVIVGIIDDGFETDHPDLVGVFDTGLSADFVDGDATSLLGASSRHGVTVTGVVAAQPGGLSPIGVAPDATVAGFRIGFGSEGNFGQLVGALRAQISVDVSNNSWGFVSPFGDNFNSPFLVDAARALEQGAVYGRDGKGVIFVFAAGNEKQEGDNVNTHNFQNSPYTIAVGAVDGTGKAASFSTPGAAVLVSALGVGVLTTDRSGDAGYVGGDTVSASGTSFAAPIVSGTVALMLEANPDLTYRDVQEIFAYSARMTDADDRGWMVNGATDFNGGGLHFSHQYGFGLVDAHAAVRLAETWSSRGADDLEIVTVGRTFAGGLSIPDGQGSIEVAFDVLEAVVIDRVVVDVDIDHGWRGDLSVILTSPNGTESILVDNPGRTVSAPFGDWIDDIVFSLSSVAHYGELSSGVWTLKIEDDAVDYGGRLNSVSIDFWGDEATDSDTYIYTDEYAEFGAGSGGLIDDARGTDILNVAAVTSAVFVDLNGAIVSQIAGRSVQLADGTTIETVYSGDGDDQLFGDGFANRLFGMRGDDSLHGGAGNDSLEGGLGSDYISAGLGSDYIDGGAGVDAVYYVYSGQGVTVNLEGGAAVGGAGDTDTLVNVENVAGSGLADILVGNAGNNVLFGDADNDAISGGLGSDYIDGGAGVDAVYYLYSGQAVAVNLEGGAAVGGAGDEDTLVNVENVFGSGFADILVGNAGNNVLFGDAGNDGISGGLGSDYIDGGAGVDTVYYVYSGQATAVNLEGGAAVGGAGGEDTLVNVENVFGSGLADNLVGNAGNNVLFGDAGNDAISGGLGADYIDGGAGVDAVYYVYGGQGVTVNLEGGAAVGGAGDTDTLVNVENVFGSGLADNLVGNAGNNVLFGDAGNDAISAGLGSDYIDGGAGNDFLDGGSGFDSFVYANIAGGSGIDIINSFEDGIDRIGLKGFSPGDFSFDSVLQTLTLSDGTSLLFQGNAVTIDEADIWFA